MQIYNIKTRKSSAGNWECKVLGNWGGVIISELGAYLEWG